MIKINLLGVKKEKINIPIVMGMDFRAISWTGVILSIIIYFGVQESINIYYNQEIDKIKEKTRLEELKFKKIKKDISNHERIKNMLNEFEVKKEQLKTKTQHVSQILENKSNPRKILERLARDIGNDLWFNVIRVQNDQINISGTAYNYHSIGGFIARANESKFFGGSFKILNEEVKTESIMVKGKATNVEHFEAEGKIISYE
ncbi:MAG: hypothetical protein A2202_06300 [Bdellovibrionales bacterium RIFOXYA1_FULL_36_14]|nr:MAG: hypothetical protein A2202_06300 [Bdellovibrionales bacterium RIFOXYA1_FULL_36_14]